MKNKWGILSSLLLVLLVVQAPQFAQDTSTDPGKAQRSQLAISLLRLINTAEATYHTENGSYATWQTLLSSYRTVFAEFLARHSDEFPARHGVVILGQPGAVTRHLLPTIPFNDPPEILPGWNLRLNVHSDGQGYDLLLIDMTDEKCGYAVLTDENAVIRQSKAIDCQI
jgi:hypothetical protein